MLKTIALALMVGAAASAQVSRTKQPDVRYVPSPDAVVDAMMEMAHVTSADIVYDLGSGDGRIPITAAARFGARGVGIEIDARLVAEANANAARAHVTNRVSFINQDLFEADFTPATVVTLFLLPHLNQQLMPALKRLRPGTRIVSHQFDMGADWPPEAARDVNGLMVYLWTIK